MAFLQRSGDLPLQPTTPSSVTIGGQKVPVAKAASGLGEGAASALKTVLDQNGAPDLLLKTGEGEYAHLSFAPGTKLPKGAVPGSAVRFNGAPATVVYADNDEPIASFQRAWKALQGDIAIYQGLQNYNFEASPYFDAAVATAPNPEALAKMIVYVADARAQANTVVPGLAVFGERGRSDALITKMTNLYVNMQRRDVQALLTLADQLDREGYEPAARKLVAAALDVCRTSDDFLRVGRATKLFTHYRSNTRQTVEVLGLTLPWGDSNAVSAPYKDLGQMAYDRALALSTSFRERRKIEDERKKGWEVQPNHRQRDLLYPFKVACEPRSPFKSCDLGFGPNSG